MINDGIEEEKVLANDERKKQMVKIILETLSNMQLEKTFNVL